MQEKNESFFENVREKREKKRGGREMQAVKEGTGKREEGIYSRRGGRGNNGDGRGERQSGKTGENKKTETGVGDKSEGGNTNEDGDGRKK